MSDTPRPAAVLVQLSDPHLGSRLARDGATADDALARAVAAVNGLDIAVDLVVVTGDLTDHGRPAEYEALVTGLARLRAPYVLLPGNHDDRDALRAVLPAAQSCDIATAAIACVATAGAVRVVVLDSLVPGAERGHLGTHQLAWLDAQLAADPRPTVVAVHHPPLRIGHTGLDTMYLDDADAFGAVIERHAHVERIICGHGHRPVTARWRGTTVTMAPSSIRQFAPTFGPELSFRRTDEAPAMAVHLWLDGSLVTHIVPW